MASEGPPWPIIVVGSTSRFLENASDSRALDPVSPRTGMLRLIFQKGKGGHRDWLSVHIISR